MCDFIEKLKNFNVLELIFSYLDLQDLANCSLVSKKWRDFLNDEDNEIWRLQCQKFLSIEQLKFTYLADLPTYKKKLRGISLSWSLNDHSDNIVIKSSRTLLKRNSTQNSTDGARSKMGFSKGCHVWECSWSTELGTSAIVGVSTRNAKLKCFGYIDLLGDDKFGWGWNLVNGALMHNGSRGYYPAENKKYKYQVGERLRVILDCDRHTLSFGEKFDEFGVAFEELPNEKLYLTVTAVMAHTEISLVYLGGSMDD